MALAGIGIGRVPVYIVEQYIKTGELKVLFDEFQAGDFALNAIYPPSRHLTSRIRALIDHLVEYFSHKNYS
jgi:DNA-binding transcriptional LysR family regulator